MELQLEIIPNQSQRRGESTISFNKKSGLISLSTEATARLKIEGGHRLAIAKDPNSEKDWYLIHFKKEDDPNGIPCRVNTSQKAGASLNCSAWAHAFMDEFAGLSDKSIKAPLATAPNVIMGGGANAYAILTKALKS